MKIESESSILSVPVMFIVIVATLCRGRRRERVYSIVHDGVAKNNGQCLLLLI